MPYDETDEDLARVWWYDGIPMGRISDDERAELMAAAYGN